MHIFVILHETRNSKKSYVLSCEPGRFMCTYHFFVSWILYTKVLTFWIHFFHDIVQNSLPAQILKEVKNGAYNYCCTNTVIYSYYTKT